MSLFDWFADRRKGQFVGKVTQETDESDGLWGKHWYKNVIKTTGFITKKSVKSDYNFTQEMKDILDIIQPAYKKLSEYSI